VEVRRAAEYGSRENPGRETVLRMFRDIFFEDRGNKTKEE